MQHISLLPVVTSLVLVSLPSVMSFFTHVQRLHATKLTDLERVCLMQASLHLHTRHLLNCCLFKQVKICLGEIFHRIVECFGLKGTLKRPSSSNPSVLRRDIFHHTKLPKALSSQALNFSRDWASTIFSVFDNAVVWENQKRIWHAGIPWWFLHKPWLTFSILQSTGYVSVESSAYTCQQQWFYHTPHRENTLYIAWAPTVPCTALSLVFPAPGRFFPFQRTAGQRLCSLHSWVTCLSSFIAYFRQ